MKILHMFQPRTEGVPRYVASLALAQSQAGNSVAIAAPSEADFGIEMTGVELVEWSCSKKPLKQIWGDTASARQILNSKCPEVLHLHSTHAGVVGRLAARGQATTVYQPHGWGHHALPSAIRPFGIGWERIAARWTHAWLTDSDSEAVEANNVGLRGFDVTMAGRSVDLDLYQPGNHADRRSELGLPGLLTILSVGRLEYQKGMDVLLDAWEMAQGALPAWQLVVVGDGAMSFELRQRGVERCHFVGAQEPCLPWYQSADVFALASRWEGGSLALVEAMACGLPVVSTCASGTPEAIGAASIRPAGVVCEPDDVMNLSRLLTGLANDEDRRLEMSINARRRAAEFTTSRVVQRTMAAYRRAQILYRSQNTALAGEG